MVKMIWPCPYLQWIGIKYWEIRTWTYTWMYFCLNGKRFKSLSLGTALFTIKLNQIMFLTQIIYFVWKHQFSSFLPLKVNLIPIYDIIYNSTKFRKYLLFRQRSDFIYKKQKIEWKKIFPCDCSLITLIQLSMYICMQMLKQLYSHEANSHRTGITTK